MLRSRYPTTYALLYGKELDYWFWTYRVWVGSTRHVLERKGDFWYRWFHTTGFGWTRIPV